MCVRPQFPDLTYIGDSRFNKPIQELFCNSTKSQFTSLNMKFGVNRIFHVPRTPVYRFDLYGRYQSLLKFQVSKLFNLVRIRRFVFLKARYPDLTYMGATRFFGPIQTLFQGISAYLQHKPKCKASSPWPFAFELNRNYHKYLRIQRCSTVSKKERLPDQYFFVLQTC